MAKSTLDGFFADSGVIDFLDHVGRCSLTASLESVHKDEKFIWVSKTFNH